MRVYKDFLDKVPRVFKVHSHFRVRKVSAGSRVRKVHRVLEFKVA